MENLLWKICGITAHIQPLSEAQDDSQALFSFDIWRRVSKTPTLERF